MLSPAGLKREVKERFPRMEGMPAYRAEVLADLNGVEIETVRTILIDVGLAKPRDFGLEGRGGRRRKLTWDDIAPFYERGLTDEEIATCCGYFKGTVALCRRASGMPPHVRRRRS